MRWVKLKECYLCIETAVLVYETTQNGDAEPRVTVQPPAGNIIGYVGDDARRTLACIEAAIRVQAHLDGLAENPGYEYTQDKETA